MPIEISDSVYSFCEIMDGIDLKKYLAVKESKTDIRYMWLLDGRKAPSFMTIDNFMREDLSFYISDIFTEINKNI